MLVVHRYATAHDAFPRIEAKEWEDLELEKALSVFTAESIGGTAFTTNHGSALSEEIEQGEPCFPET